MTTTRMGQLRQVFNSKIKFSTKYRYRNYKTTICSLTTYGCESWNLDNATMSSLNGINVRCLSHITGNQTTKKPAHTPTHTTLCKTVDMTWSHFVYVGMFVNGLSQRAHLGPCQLWS